MSMLDDIRFWAQVIGDAERTLIVNPDLESRAIEMARTYGVEKIVRVVANPACPVASAYWIDEPALLASSRARQVRLDTGGV